MIWNIKLQQIGFNVFFKWNWIVKCILSTNSALETFGVKLIKVVFKILIEDFKDLKI